MLDLDGLRELVAGQGYGPLFVTVSGAHLYGFSSPDSDVDLRGCHLLPLREIVGLDMPAETLEHNLDHDARCLTCPRRHRPPTRSDGLAEPNAEEGPR